MDRVEFSGLGAGISEVTKGSWNYSPCATSLRDSDECYDKSS